MRTICITFLIAVSGLLSYAQTRTIYYTRKWEIASKENASYYRICKIEAGLNKYFYTGSVEDYSMEGQLVMKGAYDEHGLKTGEFVLYYPNGQVQAQGNFKNDLRERTWKYFFGNGALEREVKFPVQERFKPLQYDFEPVSVYDSAGTQLIKDGTGQWHYEYEWYGITDRYIVDGKFEKGKKEGLWTCTLSNGQLLYREIYKNNRLKEGFVTDGKKHDKLTESVENKFMLPYKFEVTENFVYSTGTTLNDYPFLSFLPHKRESFEATPEGEVVNDSIPEDEKVFLAVEQQAEFPGGMAGLMDFLKNNTKFPPEARKKMEGKVFVKFIVEIDGSISNIEVVKGLSPSLDQESIRLVSVFPRWIPGKQNQKAVRSQFVLPIYFKINN
jgi:TonB family protein